MNNYVFLLAILSLAAFLAAWGYVIEHFLVKYW